MLKTELRKSAKLCCAHSCMAQCHRPSTVCGRWATAQSFRVFQTCPHWVDIGALGQLEHAGNPSTTHSNESRFRIVLWTDVQLNHQTAAVPCLLVLEWRAAPPPNTPSFQLSALLAQAE